METTPWVETHAHLSDPKFDADRDEVIRRAVQKNKAPIIEIADGPDEWEKAKLLAEAYTDQIWWAAGIHPYYADQGTLDNLRQLKTLTQHPQFVAIGEVGLDYFKCTIPHETQKNTFSKAIELAQETDKPLIIHCRDAYADLLPILKKYFSPAPKNSPGVVHCFSGNANNAAEIINLGFYLGVDGPVTYPNAKALRTTLQTVPPEKLVIETDSPYLPPQDFRGQRNEPSYLSHIGEALAAVKDLSPSDLAKILSKNSHDLFRLP